MNVIKVDLSEELENIQIHLFSDEHLGDCNSDIQRLKARIKKVQETENAYCILNGDILDNATRTSIGDIYGTTMQPMAQLELAVELFTPIKDKILAITHGNHELRTYKKEGIDLSKILAVELGLLDRYSPTSALVFVRFGRNSEHSRKQWYSIYAVHGSGGGRKEGAKAIRLADMASIIDADIYIHGHTHLPMIMKQGYYRVSPINSSVEFVNKLFINTAANLGYGGYGEAQEYKPNSKDMPIIYLLGKRKEMTAKL